MGRSFEGTFCYRKSTEFLTLFSRHPSVQFPSSSALFPVPVPFPGTLFGALHMSVARRMAVRPYGRVAVWR